MGGGKGVGAATESEETAVIATKRMVTFYFAIYYVQVSLVLVDDLIPTVM
jgi:hypothetical protein